MKRVIKHSNTSKREYIPDKKVNNVKSKIHLEKVRTDDDQHKRVQILL